MPLRGESIGTAYIRVLADGSDFAKSIKDDLEKDNGKFEDAGSAQAKAYKKGLKDELEGHDDLGRSLDDALTKALIKDDSLDKFFASSHWTRQRTNWEAKWGELGTTAADQIEEKFRKSGSLDGIEADSARIVSRINNIADAQIKASENAAEKARLAMVKFENEFRATMEETDRLSKQVSADHISSLESIRRKYEDLRGVIPALRKEMVNLTNDVRTTTNDTKQGRNALQDMGIAMSDLAERISFGKGSRNNFVNFIGSFIVGINKAIATIPKFLGDLLALPGAFNDARAAGEGFSSALSSVFGGGGEGGKGLAGLLADGPAGIAAIAAAFTVLIAVLGPVAALISGIAAALTALVSSLSFAVVGVLAPLVGLLPVVAVGIAAVVTGLVGMSDKAKKAFKDGVKPLVDGFKELGTQARAGFFSTFKIQSDDVKAALKTLNPLLRATGAAIGDVITKFTTSLGSSQFAVFIKAMTGFIPDAINSLSTSFANLAQALGNIFIDLIPQTQDFLGWLEKITGEFAKWTGSKSGRKEIRQFLDDAAQSAKVVGHFLGDVVGLLATILDAGKKPGDNIISDLGGQIERFNTFLKENPDALKNFFANGQQVATDLGNVAVELGRVFDALDSPESRRALHVILSLTDNLIRLGANLVTYAQDIILATIFIFHGIVGAAKPVVHWIDVIAQKIGDFQHFGRGFNPFSAALAGARRFGHFLSGLDLSKVFSGGNHVMLINTTGWIPGAIRRISGFAGDAKRIIVSQFQNITKPISTVATTVTGYFTRLKARLSGLDFGSAARQWKADILSILSDVPGAIVDMFRGLGDRISAVIGEVLVKVGFSGPKKALEFLTGGIVHAKGGIFDQAHLATIAEAGAEAVVPLTGPLSNVDPAVRELSAIARGLLGKPSGGTVSTGSVGVSSGGSGKSIVNHWQIVTPENNAKSVATELLNQMVASAY